MFRVVVGCGSAIPLQEVHTMLELRKAELELVEFAPGDETELLRDPFDADAGALTHAHSIAPPPADEVVERCAELVPGRASGLVHAAPAGAAAAGAGGAPPLSHGPPQEQWARARAPEPPLRALVPPPREPHRMRPRPPGPPPSPSSAPRARSRAGARTRARVPSTSSAAE